MNPDTEREEQKAFTLKEDDPKCRHPHQRRDGEEDRPGGLAEHSFPYPRIGQVVDQQYPDEPKLVGYRQEDPTEGQLIPMIIVQQVAGVVDLHHERVGDHVARDREELQRERQCDTQRAPDQIGQPKGAQTLLHPLAVGLVVVQSEQVARDDEEHGDAEAEQPVGEEVFHKGGRRHRLGRCAPRL